MRRLVLIALLLAPAARAGEADVLAARLERAGAGWRLVVTIAHADGGWGHYADAFRAVTPEGVQLGVRTLLHPHVDEQPFTRSLQGLVIPEGVRAIRVEAHDGLHGWGGAYVEVLLPR